MRPFRRINGEGAGRVGASVYGDLEEFVEFPVGQDLPPAILNLPREGLKELVVPRLSPENGTRVPSTLT